MNTPPVPEITAISWKDLTGNQFQVKPTVAMLLPLGYTRACKVGKRRAKQMEWKQVIFDSDYVRAYFAKHFENILESKNDHVHCCLSIALRPLLSPCGGHDDQV